MDDTSYSLYIHIPYCLHKCPYCDFNTYAVNRIPEKEYTNALLAEFDSIISTPEWNKRSLRTIYFGGGTPSLFSASSIEKLMVAFCQAGTDELSEVTLEANPGALTFDHLQALKTAGINRLSLGAQSFSQRSLLTLGRIHKPEDIELGVSYARDVGFNNINLDLMYGLPDQSVDEVAADLERYIAIRPEHVSAYGLTIEKGTPFFQRHKKGTLLLPAEDALIEMMQLVNNTFTDRSYERYEISNFARPGFEAVHNVGYWKNMNYIGLGAGAHSYRRCTPGESLPSWGHRTANIADPALYMDKAMSTGKAIAWEEHLTREDAIFEAFFLGLRMKEGVSISTFTDRFGVLPEAVYANVLHDLRNEGLVSMNDTHITLTPPGQLLADSVIEQFSSPESVAPQLAGNH
jgi:oxygen-independent coproporphyrinogen-3 oxidase